MKINEFRLGITNHLFHWVLWKQLYKKTRSFASAAIQNLFNSDGRTYGLVEHGFHSKGG